MNKKFLPVSAALAAMLGCTLISACVVHEAPPQTVHQHSFTAYDYDDVQHWSICPDDGALNPTSYRYHDFTNGDCVCGKEGHKHAWSEEWSTDSLSHWHKCEGCDDYDRESIGSHVSDKKPENALFDQTDHWYSCEVCGEKFDTEAHSVQPYYSKNDEGHWSACYNCDYKIDFEEHDFSGGDKCACGYDLKGTDGLVYELVNGYFVVKSIGTATDKNIVIPSTYEGKEVLKIGEGAFQGAEIESVRIPATITTIEANAFANCAGIKNVTLPSGISSIANSAFSGCAALESINLEGGENNKFATIDGVLYGKNDTTGGVVINRVITVPAAIKGTVNVPDGVSSITFTGCVGLQEVIFGTESKMTKLADSAFKGCSALTDVTLPSNLTQIGRNAFELCSELTSVKLPEKLLSIGQSAFYKCKKLTGITIPSSVTEIGNYAFTSCSVMTDLTFGENIKIKKIGNTTFGSCSLLKSVKIPEGVTELGQMAFQSCKNLTEVTLPSTLTTIGISVFEGCGKIEKIAIPVEVTSIGNMAFRLCASLNELTFAENSKLKTTGTGVFSSCTSLTSVALPDSLETVGNSLFNGCTNLSEIKIGENSQIKTIGNIAFINCAITYIVIPPLSVPESENSIGNTIFDGCNQLTKIYYKGTKAEWESLKIDSRDETLSTDSRLSFYVANEEELPSDGGSYWHFVDGKPVEW